MSIEFFNQKIQEQINERREAASKHGWDFAERTPDSCTIGDLVGAICSIDNDEDAARFYAGHVESIQAAINAGDWKSACTAEEGARANIGWCYGEGISNERIAMWRRVTGAEHPFLPAIEALTPAEIYQAGKTLGSKL